MFQNNKVNLIISIVAAIGLWAYVFFEINPVKNKTISDVPVKLVGVSLLQDRNLTVREDSQHTVTVKIKGPRSEVSQVKASDIEATADVSSFTEGENDVKVNVSVPDGVSKDDVNPSVVTIVIEEYVKVSKSVEVKFEGTFADDTEPGFVSRNPETIDVSGAKSLVGKVDHVQAAVKSESVKDKEQNQVVLATPVDKNGDVVNGLTLSEKNVDVKCTLCYLKTVPLEVPIKGKIDSDYEVTAQKVPDTIKIKGVKSQVDSITSVKAKSIDISDIKETTEIPVEINLPKNVELTKESENLVVVIEISGISVKDLAYDSTDISVKNLKSGYKAQLSDSNIKVSVYGNSDFISALTRNDITLYIDLTDADYTQGAYAATIKYVTKKNPERVVIYPEKIQVSISEQG